MQLKDLQFFKELSQTLNFRQTAAEFKVSQSTISRSISRLEEHLGAQLFSREGRKVFPSAFGRAMQPVLFELQSKLEETEKTAMSLLRAEQGHLRIGIDETTQYPLVRPLFESFSQKMPETQLELIHASGKELEKSLHNAELDAVLTNPSTKAAENFRITTLISEPLVLVRPATKPGNEVQLFANHLDNKPLMVNVMMDRVLLDEALAPLNYTPSFIRRCERIDWLIGLVESNFGYGLIPKSVAEQSGLDIVWTFQDVIPSNDLAFLTSRGRAFTPALRAFDLEATFFARNACDQEAMTGT